MDKETPVSTPSVKPRWYGTWLLMLVGVGFIWWLPSWLMAQTLEDESSTGLVIWLLFIVWTILGRFIKWVLLNIVSYRILSHNLPATLVDRVFKKFLLLLSVGMLSEILVYLQLLQSSDTRNELSAGFILDIFFPLAVGIFTIFLIRRAHAASAKGESQ